MHSTSIEQSLDSGHTREPYLLCMFQLKILATLLLPNSSLILCKKMPVIELYPCTHFFHANTPPPSRLGGTSLHPVLILTLRIAIPISHLLFTHYYYLIQLATDNLWVALQLQSLAVLCQEDPVKPYLRVLIFHRWHPVSYILPIPSLAIESPQYNSSYKSPSPVNHPI